MAVGFQNSILSGSLNISGSFNLPIIPNLNTLGEVGEIAVYNEVPYVYTSTGWVRIGVNSSSLSEGNTDIEYLVVAGGGGAGGYNGSNYFVGGNGGNSSISGDDITTVTSTGGGRGAVWEGGSQTDQHNAGDGGSGGGASGNAELGNGTSGQGNDGGARDETDSPVYHNGSGGGGGAGQVGQDGTDTKCGDGGDGKQSNITGTATYYAGGGGGGAASHGDIATAGDGGQGGGGNGTIDGVGNAGTVNTGGGGGAGDTGVGANHGGAGAGGLLSSSFSSLTSGSSYTVTVGAGGSAGGSYGGAGGSGVVILAYDSGSMNAIGGQEGDAGNGRKYHKFNSSGTFYTGLTTDFKIVTEGLHIHFDAANTDSYIGTGTSVTDLTGNGQTGTFYGDTSFINTHGGGFSFDGAGGDYISWTNSGTDNIFCIDVWFDNDDDITSAIIDGPYQVMLTACGTYHHGGFALGAWTGQATNETVIFYTNGGASTRGTYIRDSITSGIHNMVANWNGSSYDIWVDGSKKTTYNMSGGHSTQQALSGAGRLGGEPGGNGYDFDGSIHNFKLYTSSLTDTQVTQNYNALKNRFGV